LFSFEASEPDEGLEIIHIRRNEFADGGANQIQFALFCSAQHAGQIGEVLRSAGL
jgi:hypothetical protein